MTVKGRSPRKRPATRTGQGTEGEPVERTGKEGQLVGNLYDSMEDDSIVVVHRFDPETAKQVLMYKLMPEEATDVEIQRLSGGGKYMTREQVRNDAGQMVFGRQRSIVVSGPPLDAVMPRSYSQQQGPAQQQPEIGTRGQPGATGTQPQDILSAGMIQLFDGMQRLNATQAEAYRSMANQTPTEWGPIALALAPVIIAWIKASSKDTAPDPMALVEKVASLMKANTSPTESFKDMLETVDTVFDIKERSQGPPADPLTSLTSLLPQILEAISVEQKAGRPATTEAVRARLGIASPGDKQTGDKPPPPPMYRQMLDRFRPMLLQWARAGKDPALMGDWLVNMIPEKYHGHLREFLLRDDAEELVYQAIPDLRQFEQWTADCFGQMADTFNPPTAEELEEEARERDDALDEEAREIEEQPGDSPREVQDGEVVEDIPVYGPGEREGDTYVEERRE